MANLLICNVSMVVLPVQSSVQLPMANLQCLHCDLSEVQLCLAKSVFVTLVWPSHHKPHLYGCMLVFCSKCVCAAGC